MTIALSRVIFRETKWSTAKDGRQKLTLLLYVLYVEINLENNQQTQLIVLEKGTKFRWYSIHDDHSSRASHIRNRELAKLKHQTKEVQNVITHQVIGLVEQRKAQLEILEQHVEKMSEYSQQFAAAAQQVKTEQRIKKNCFCCGCCAVKCSRCCNSLKLCFRNRCVK